MLLAVSVGFGQDPLRSLTTTGQPVDSVSIFSPDQPLVVGVPYELKMFLVEHVLWNCKLDLEPVRRPAGTE